jgi:hypothetical protein
MTRGGDFFLDDDEEEKFNAIKRDAFYSLKSDFSNMKKVMHKIGINY